MTLQELVACLMSHPLYQQGKAATTEVVICEGEWQYVSLDAVLIRTLVDDGPSDEPVLVLQHTW